MTVIVISDLRALLISTVLYIYKIKKKSDEVILIASQRLLEGSDFGHFYPRWYKFLKLFILKLFFKVKIIKTSSNTTLNNEDVTGIISSLCSITKDSLADQNRYSNIYLGLECLAKGSKEISIYLSKFNIKEIFIFNGRTAASEPLVRFCFHNNIKIKYYEFGFNVGSHFTIFNFPIHNGYRYGKELVNYYEKNILHYPNVYTLGDKFCKLKLSNTFTKNYLSISKKKYDIVIFLGSDHEYTNLNEEICGINYIGNLELCKRVLSKYGKDKKYAVRAHPNQVNDISCNQVLDSVIEFCRENGIDFYDPTSPISSHSLIENSHLTAVELSSIAVDAIILEKDVYIWGQNELKAILDSCPIEIKTNKLLLKDYVCQVFGLTEKVFQHKLPFVYNMLYKFIFITDRFVKKIYTKASY